VAEAPHTVPNGVQLRIAWFIGGTTFNNVLHASKVGGVAVDQALANAVDSAVKAAFTSSGLAAHIVSGCSLSVVGVRDVASKGMAEFLGSGAAVPGTATGDALPSRTALCITHRTARAGRSFRGRSFLPGFGEADNDSAGHASATATAAGAAFFNTIRTTLPSTLVLGVGSADRYDANGNVIRAGFVTPISISLSRNNLFETQRRRVF
jgi:hypothetical protein